MEVPRKRDTKYPASSKPNNTPTSSSSSLPQVSSSTTSGAALTTSGDALTTSGAALTTSGAALPTSGAAVTTEKPPLGDVEAPKGTISFTNPCNKTYTDAIAVPSEDGKSCLVRECRTFNETSGLYEKNCKLSAAEDGKFLIETDHFTEFTVAEYEEKGNSEMLVDIIETTSFDFYTSDAWYLFIAVICIFGVALIAGLISDCVATTSTAVHPVGSTSPLDIPADFKCSALLHLRNPVRLFTLTTPRFSRFFRILFYFCYVFFLYGLSGQLSQHIALFLAVGVIGGFAGIVLNILKGFYVSGGWIG